MTRDLFTYYEANPGRLAGEPDAMVRLSAKTELRETGKHEFYWNTLSVRGLLQQPAEGEGGN